MNPDPDPGWFSGSRTSMERLTQKIKNTKRRLANDLENSFTGILNIFHRSGPRAPDPNSDPETGSTSLEVIPGMQSWKSFISEPLTIPNFPGKGYLKYIKGSRYGSGSAQHPWFDSSLILLCNNLSYTPVKKDTS